VAETGHGFVWQMTMVNEAAEGVARRRHLYGERAREWRQEAWLHLVEHGARLSQSFRGTASARTFLGAVLDHHCVDWLRRENRIQRSPQHPLGEAALGIHTASERMFIDPMIALEEEVERTKLMKRLRTALAQLSPCDRGVVTACCINGEPVCDWAAVAGCTPAAARQRLCRALRRLSGLVFG
jgi:RNA polymerase sigma factor (sigma-70 family)